MPVLALLDARSGAKGGPTLQRSEGNGGPEFRGGSGHLLGRHITMKMFAAQLAARVLDRPVLDQTGIAGEFDIELEYTPEGAPDPGLSIFTALHEKYGLKLEARIGLVEVLIVDQVERPSTN